MSRSPHGVVLVTAMLFLLAGCGKAVHYFGDPSPRMEQARYLYVKYHPGDEFNNEVLSGRVCPGMNREEVRASWGEPNDIGVGTHARVDEMWMYRDDEPSRGNVYLLSFKDDRLTRVEVVSTTMAGTSTAARAQREEQPEDVNDEIKKVP